MATTQTNNTDAGILHPATHIGLVVLTVADSGRSLAFYRDVIGFEVLAQQDQQVVLGVEKQPLLVLTEHPGVSPKPHNTPGLFHFAILVPDRVALGHSLLRLAETKYPLDGASDHAVSEALYLSDPDGNGIEIYRDRLRNDWPWQSNQVAMVSERLDIEGIITEVGDKYDWHGLAPQTSIGHMHLQVSDLRTAEDFYCRLLGFEMMQRMPGALFVSAGKYHHHLGLNTWSSRGAARAPYETAGLRLFSITLPDVAELERLSARLQNAGISSKQTDGVVRFFDPWQNGIVLSVGSLKDAEFVRSIARA